MRKFRPISVRPIILVLLLVLIFFYLQNMITKPSGKTDGIKFVSSGLKTEHAEDLSVSTIFVSKNIASEETKSYIKSFDYLKPENIIIALQSPNSSKITLSSNVKVGVQQKLESLSLKQESGEDNFTPEVEKIFSDSSIVTLFLGDDLDSVYSTDVISELYGLFNERQTLVIVAFDSLSIDHELAENQKLYMENALFGFQPEDLSRIGDNMGGIISFGMTWADKVKTKKFNLSKSGCIKSECYIHGYYKKGDIENPSRTTVFTIGGDMMFDRGVNYKFPGDKIFDSLSNISSLFESTDLSLVNLEGPISPTPIDNELSYSLVFNFPPKTTEALKKMRINGVSLANNHTNNNGPIGLSNTKKVLKENGITSIGEERVFNEGSVAVFSGGFQDISVITINCLEVNKDLNDTIVAEKTKGNFIIIFPHWGVEYEAKHSRSQQNLAYSWIDSGADLIVGTHPHVVQDAEIYKNKAIFYSIGNLLFDQTWSEPTQKGLVLSGVISQDGVKIVLLPTKSVGLKPHLLSGEEKTSALQIYKNILVNNEQGVLQLGV